MTIDEQLALIRPGKTYPVSVTVTEDGHTIKFLLCSYVVGMYVAVHIDGTCADQIGDNNNTKTVRKLKLDIVRAIKRGATVEIGSILPIKTL